MTEEMIESLLLVCKRIEELLYLGLYQEREKIIETALGAFGTSKRRVDVYFALDGMKTATEIALELNMKRPNVSIEIGILFDSGLIEQVEDKQGSPYRRRMCFELIGLSSAVRTKFAASKQYES
ncbi:MAG: hypothetical protein RTV41_01670 [Candidatus Thorarchaeota archaeon]